MTRQASDDLKGEVMSDLDKLKQLTDELVSYVAPRKRSEFREKLNSALKEITHQHALWWYKALEGDPSRLHLLARYSEWVDGFEPEEK